MVDSRCDDEAGAVGAQRGHRADFGGTTSGEPRGKQRSHRQNGRRERERKRIGRADFKENAAHDFSRPKGKEKSQSEAGRDHGEAFA